MHLKSGYKAATLSLIAAYDGDMSEMDDSATTFSESGVVHRLMPDFWLIMHIHENFVEILFQHR